MVTCQECGKDLGAEKMVAIPFRNIEALTDQVNKLINENEKLHAQLRNTAKPPPIRTFQFG